MKRLVLIRHGKSSWDHPDLLDHQRPLKKRGVKNAFTVAEHLWKNEVKPDLVLTSPAVRALDTAVIVATRMAYPLEGIRTNPAIYEASSSSLLDIIRNVEDQVQTLFFFGHNPGFTDLVNTLQDEVILNLPTCGTMVIDLPVDTWSQITNVVGHQRLKLIPRELA